MLLLLLLLLLIILGIRVFNSFGFTSEKFGLFSNTVELRLSDPLKPSAELLSTLDKKSLNKLFPPSNKHPPFILQKRALIQIFDLNISDDDEDVDLDIFIFNKRPPRLSAPSNTLILKAQYLISARADIRSFAIIEISVTIIVLYIIWDIKINHVSLKIIEKQIFIKILTNFQI